MQSLSTTQGGDMSNIYNRKTFVLEYEGREVLLFTHHTEACSSVYIDFCLSDSIRKGDQYGELVAWKDMRGLLKTLFEKAKDYAVSKGKTSLYCSGSDLQRDRVYHYLAKKAGFKVELFIGDGVRIHFCC